MILHRKQQAHCNCCSLQPNSMLVIVRTVHIVRVETTLVTWLNSASIWFSPKEKKNDGRAGRSGGFRCKGATFYILCDSIDIYFLAFNWSQADASWLMIAFPHTLSFSLEPNPFHTHLRYEMFDDLLPSGAYGYKNFWTTLR